MNETGDSKNLTHNLSGGANYRFDQQWQLNGSLGLSGSSSKTSVAGQDQKNKMLFGNVALMYSDIFLGNYLVSGGYTVAQTRSQTSPSDGLSAQRSTTHAANIGYTRMGSQLYADSLQLLINRIVGEPSGSELNVRYSVNSMLTQSDMLQGVADYRRSRQSNAVRSNSTLTPQSYDLNSKSARLNFNWKHRFMEAGSSMLSIGADRGESQGVATAGRYAQVSFGISLSGALQWTALARKDQMEGLAAIAGRKLTVESDLNYRIGKWQASARYRYRDVQQQLAPFKENSITFMLKRDYGFRL